MNKALKTNQLPKIRKIKRMLYRMRFMAGHGCNFKDFHLADEIMAKIESGKIVFS